MAAAAPPPPGPTVEQLAQRRAARDEYQKYGEIFRSLIHRRPDSLLSVAARTTTGSVKGWLASTAVISWHVSTVSALEPTEQIAKGFAQFIWSYVKEPFFGLADFLISTAPAWLQAKVIELAAAVWEQVKEITGEVIGWVSTQLIRLVLRFFGLPEDLIERFLGYIPGQWVAMIVTFLAYTAGLIGPILNILRQVGGAFIKFAWSAGTIVFEQVIKPILRAARRYLFSGPSFIEQVERQMNLHPLSHRPFPLMSENNDSLRKTSRDMIVNVGWSFSLLGIGYYLAYDGKPRMELTIHRRRPRPRLAAVEIHPADTYNSRLNVVGQSFNVYHVGGFLKRRAHGQGWRVQPVASRLRLGGFFSGGWGEDFEVEYPEAYIFAALERAIVADPFGAQVITCRDDLQGPTRDMAAKGIQGSRRGWQHHSITKLWQWSSPLLRLSHRLGWVAGAGHELLEMAAALQLKLRVGQASEWLQAPTVTNRWYRAMVDSAELVLRLRTATTELGLDPWFYAPWSASRRSRKWTEPNLLVLRKVPLQYAVSLRILTIMGVVLPPPLPPLPPPPDEWLHFLLYVIDLSHVLEVAVEIHVPVPVPLVDPVKLAGDLQAEVGKALLHARELGAMEPDPNAKNTLAQLAQHMFRNVTATAVSIEGLTWPNLTCRGEGDEVVYRYLAPQWLPPGEGGGGGGTAAQ